jgi:O-antigen/teichoic acid export membrane protein
MESASRDSAWWHYPAALPLVLLGIALGNLLGVVLASVSGWQSIEIGRPGGVAVGFVQGVVGAIAAAACGNRLFKRVEPVDFWLKVFVGLAALLIAVALIVSLYRGNHGALLTWSIGAGVAGVAGTEVGRRLGRDRLNLSSPRSPA